MKQYFRALDMAQKFDAKSLASRCPFDKSGNISEDKFVIRSQAWFECGEWVVGDFALRAGQFIDQARFASIGQTNETDMCNELKFETHGKIFSQQSLLKLGWRSISRRPEKKVAFAAVSAFGDKDPFTNFEDFLGNSKILGVTARRCAANFMNYSAYGNFEDKIFRICAVGKLCFAVRAIFCANIFIVSELAERTEIRNAFHIYAAAIASPAAGRTQSHG